MPAIADDVFADVPAETPTLPDNVFDDVPEVKATIPDNIFEDVPDRPVLRPVVGHLREAENAPPPGTTKPAALTPEQAFAADQFEKSGFRGTPLAEKWDANPRSDAAKWWQDLNTPIIRASPTGGGIGGFQYDDPEKVAESKRIREEGLSGEKIALGIREGADEFLSGLTTPLSLGTLGIGGLIKGGSAISRLLSGWFALHTGKTLAVDTAQALGEEYAKPPEQRDTTKLASLWTGASLSAPLTAALGVHAIRGQAAPLTTPRGPTREDHLQTLGLKPEATAEDIKAAFRAKAKEFHPDVNPSPEAAAEFRKVMEAYSALTPPKPAQAEPKVEPIVPKEPTVTQDEIKMAEQNNLNATAAALKDLSAKKAPPAAPTPAAAPQPKPPVPETAEAVITQMRVTSDPNSTKSVTLVTPGSPKPAEGDLKAHGLEAVDTPHGLAVFNPAKTTRDAVLAAAQGKDFDGTLLGFSTKAKPTPMTDIVVQTTLNGVPVLDEVVENTPEAIAAAKAAHAKAVPGGVSTVRNAGGVIRERKEKTEPEKRAGNVTGAKIDEGEGIPILEQHESGVWPSGTKGFRDEEKQALDNAKKTGKITIYRAVIKGQPIRAGDFVTLRKTDSEAYPYLTAPGTEIVSMEVDVADVHYVGGTGTWPIRYKFPGKIKRKDSNVPKPAVAPGSVPAAGAPKQPGVSPVPATTAPTAPAAPTEEQRQKDIARFDEIDERVRQMVKLSGVPATMNSPEYVALAKEQQEIKNRYEGHKPHDAKPKNKQPVPAAKAPEKAPQEETLDDLIPEGAMRGTTLASGAYQTPRMPLDQLQEFIAKAASRGWRRTLGAEYPDGTGIATLKKVAAPALVKETAPKSAPVKTEKPGAMVRIMGENMTLVRSEEVRGIRYEMFVGEKASAIRVIDVDTGNVASLKKYPAGPASAKAKEEFEQAISIEANTPPAPKAGEQLSIQTATSILRDRVIALPAVQNALKNSPHNLLVEIESNIAPQIGAMAAEMMAKPGVDGAGRSWPASYNSLTVADKAKLAQAIHNYLLRTTEAEKPKEPRKAGDLTGLSDAELDAMLDEASGTKAPVVETKPPVPETKASEPATIKLGEAPQPQDLNALLAQLKEKRAKQGRVTDDRLEQMIAQVEGLLAKEKEPKIGEQPTERTAADIAAEAAKLGVKGAEQAIEGLHKLFGGGKNVGSGPAFDEKTYAEAKPHFESAYQNFKAAGKSLAEFLKFVFDQFGKNVRDYIKRFIKEKQQEEANALAQRGGGSQAGQPAPTGTTEPAGAIGSGQLGGKQPEAGPGVGSGRQPAAAGEGSTGTGAASPEQSTGGQPERPREPRGVRGVRGTAPENLNYVITDADQLGKGTAKQKFQDNVRAIQLVRTLEKENRAPTNEERAQLVKYVGWGGIKGAFDPSNKTFAKEFQQLRDLLTDEEYAAARASIQDAHYTSQTVIDHGIYNAMERLGFRGGRMVEGGVGIGNFIGLLPENWRKGTTYLGIERDPLTAKIAKYLYPEAKILEMGYQDADLKRDSFDGAVGNPPFGNKSIYDKNFTASSKHSIHNYFIGKTLELVKPGGVTGFVVSRYFLDAVDPTARQYIASLGEFLGAIRLPNTAFKENAGTEVVTDLVFFKRVPEGTTTNTDWTKTVDFHDPKSGLTWKVNSWIADHPEMILGEMRQAEHGMHGKTDMSVEPREGQDLAADLDKAVEQLPKNVYTEVPRETKERLTTPEKIMVPDEVKVGGLYADGSKVYKRLPDENAERKGVVVEMPEGQAARVRGIIPIRDALNSLIKAELSTESTPEHIEALRKKLNTVYDAFVKKNGFLNTPTNRRAFFEDAENMRVLGLEKEYQSGVTEKTAKAKGVEAVPASAKKADIFVKRVNAPYQEITKVETPKEALTVSLNQRGKVDLEHMADLTGMEPKAILDVLEGLVFKTPEGTYESKEQYLSGNVRAKLKAAEEAVALDPEMRKNVEALTPVIPKDIAPTDIIAPVGAPWVEAKDVSQFATELTGSEPDTVLFQKANAGWTFRHTDRSNASTQQWGTERMPFGDLFKQMLNGKAIVVYDELDKADGGTVRVVNQPQTELANAKADEIKQKWQDWLWKDKERRDRLHRVYNDNFNNYVPFSADGSHLTLPGASTAITLNPHQKNVVWRTITNGDDGLLYDHVVGAGKTFAGVASMMEMKRLGRVKKWIVAVPNHLTGQWADAFTTLYPNSNFLAARPSDFKKENRQKLFAKILTGDYDAVILGHSSLKKVGTSPEVEQTLLQEMLDEIIETIQAMKDAEGKKGSRAIAAMEKTRDNIKAKIAKLSDIKGRDVVAQFEELGFDGMFLDEAHEFKNLFYTTQMQNVAGLGNPKGSGKAFDLYLKTRFLRNQFGGKAPIVFATGTPISNSLVEMFTMQRYLQPDVLNEMGLKTLDAWARVFADVRAVYEVDPTGTGYRMATRLANFQNVGELTAIYRNMADVITMNDLQTQAESAGKRFPVPKVKGGKPQNLVAERTPEQAEYFGIVKPGTEENPQYPEGTILWRVDNMPDDPRVDNMLKLTNDARKAGLDMRLVHPNAPDRPESKVNKAVSEIARIYKLWTPKKGTQLVFCDLSVPASARGKATAKAKTGGAGYYINVKGNLKPVEAKPVVIDAKPGYNFFIRKSELGSWVISEVSSGLSAGGASTQKEAIEVVNKRLASLAEGVFERAVAEGQPTPEALAEFKAAQEPVEVEPPEESDDAPEAEEGVSVDELLADTSSFSVYDDMKAKLIKAGVPEKEIAFIHDYDTPEKKMKLFKQVNAGDVRILFGSTAKMGAGTNVQKKIVALHHMDAPWRPSDLEQREGRAIRQGNEFYEAEIGKYAKPQDYDTDPQAFALEINRYATALTYDTRMWQLIEHKAAGIEGFRKADRTTRTIEDVGGEAANASDMKAAASGDPLIQQELQLRNDAKKLELLKKAWTNNRIELQNREAYLRDFDVRYQSRMAELERTKEVLAANTPLDKEGKPVFQFTKPDGTVTDEKGTALEVAVQGIKEGKRGYFGKYRGFDFSFEPSERKVQVYDEAGKKQTVTEHSVTFYRGKQNFDYNNKVTTFSGDERLTGVGLFQRIDNSFGDYDSDVKWAAEKRDQAAKQLTEVREELAKPFPKEEQLKKATEAHSNVRTQLMNKRKPKAPPDINKGALGEQGMGGAKPGEAGKAELAQLTDALRSMAGSATTKLSAAFDLGASVAKAKESIQGALNGLKAAAAYMKMRLEGKPVVTDWRRMLGDRHLALSESAINARRWAKAAMKAMPDPKLREAISNWIDMGGDNSELARAAAETRPQYKAGYERARVLTPEEKTAAENIRNYFESRLQDAIDAGILEDGIENYIHRIYETDSPWKNGVLAELRSGIFTGRPGLAKQRVFEYDLDAEKAGKSPVKDFVKRVAAYDLALNKAIADREAVKAMMEIRMPDGRPMISIGGGGKVIEKPTGETATFINRSARNRDESDAKAFRGDYKAYDHPALRKWKWVLEDEAGNQTYVMGDVLVHPDAIRQVKVLFDRSAVRQHPLGRAALAVSSTVKQTMLDLSGFHQVQIGVHGMEHKTFKPVKEIDFEDPDVRGLIRGGAVVGETSGRELFYEGLAGSSLTRHIPWVGERIQAYQDYLFGDFIPRIKVAMGLHALERNRERFPHLSKEALYQMTADQMNAAFGELNYEMLGRSKTVQDALRLALLAPDFLEARSRFTAQAFTKFGTEQRAALLLGAITMYILARLLNKWLNDEWHFEAKNAFNVVYNGRAYGLRTVQGDLIHAVTEPGQFANHRLNPTFGRPTLEFLTGRDYFGRKREMGDKLADYAQTIIPISLRGAVSGQEQTLFDSFLNAFGFVAKRDSPSSDIAKMATEWRKENKVGNEPGEFVYDADRDKYRKMRLAAERGDEAGVRSEAQKAINDGLTRQKIREHFRMSAKHNFAGTKSNEAKFVASLTDDQKKIYADARRERERIRDLVLKVVP